MLWDKGFTKCVYHVSPTPCFVYFAQGLSQDSASGDKVTQGIGVLCMVIKSHKNTAWTVGTLRGIYYITNASDIFVINNQSN